MNTSSRYQVLCFVIASLIITNTIAVKELRRTNKLDPTIARLLQLAGRHHHPQNTIADVKLNTPSKRGDTAWIWLPGQGYAEVPAELAAEVAQGINDEGVANKLMRYGRRR